MRRSAAPSMMVRDSGSLTPTFRPGLQTKPKFVPPGLARKVEISPRNYPCPTKSTMSSPSVHQAEPPLPPLHSSAQQQHQFDQEIQEENLPTPDYKRRKLENFLPGSKSNVCDITNRVGGFVRPKCPADEDTDSLAHHHSQSDVDSASLAIRQRTPDGSTIIASQSLYFSVVWCKMSKKKHKKWESDAVLVTGNRSATLYDMEGKVIGKGTGYKTTELQSLKEDETLFVGGKEVQVLGILREADFKSGQCFTGSSESATQPQGNVSSKVSSKPFVNPLMKTGIQSNRSPSVAAASVSQSPKFDPDAPGALVMPRPSQEHQWQYNKSGIPVVDVVVDPYLATSLRDHQRDGVVFLYSCVMGFRDFQGTGAILADEMGLGKTLQCICLLWTLLKQGPYGGRPVVKKALVITPGSLVKNWHQEFNKWLGVERLSVYAVSGDKTVDGFLRSGYHPVLVISYEMFVRNFDTVKEIPFELVICDEGHRLKNTNIKTTSLIMSLTCRRRVILTGTPVQNHLHEFFSILEFCNPGILGSSAVFKRVYEEPIVASRQPKATPEQKDLGAKRTEELTRLTQMFLLRRTQEINNKYLPPKVELVLFCRPSPLQVSLYHRLIQSKMVRNCLASWTHSSGGNRSSESTAPHLVCIGALRHLCNHPGLVRLKAAEAEIERTSRGEVLSGEVEDSLYHGMLEHFPSTFNPNTVCASDSGKLTVLAQLLASIWAHSTKDKVVLVSNHTKTLDMLQLFCQLEGYSQLRLDGQTPTTQRQDIVARFNSKHCPHRIFLLSSKAGGVGLNLVGASRLVLYDIDWNPANDLQAMARVWRDGQSGKVHIYRLLTAGTIEEKMYQRQISKQGLSGAVVDLSQRSTSVIFSLQDLKDLFSLNEGTPCETHSKLDCGCQGGPLSQSGVKLATSEVASSEKVVESSRSCQLGSAGAAAPKKSSNLTMAQLLQWNHLHGHMAKDFPSWRLDQTDQALSFVFWQETNSQSF